MCFSATASFIASAALVGGGSVAIATVPFPKRAWPLALIPLIFGIHQFSEGLVWLGLNGAVSPAMEYWAMHFFNLIAMCFWPIFIPYAVYIYERPHRRIPLLALLSLGTIISAYLFYSFTIYSELSINVKCCNSIAYFYRMPYLQGIVDYFYVAVVVLPYLVSRNKRIQYALGPCFLGTFLIALAIQSGGDYPSIWCFLAAIISVVIYYSIYESSQSKVVV